MICEQCKHLFSEADSNFVCPKCAYLNKLNTNIDYFDYIGIEKALPIDMDTLDSIYIKLSSLLHPDNFVNISELQKMYATIHTSYLNDGYITLKDNLKSIAYYYKLKTKFDIIKVDEVNKSLEINKYFFELNEELEVAKNNEQKSSYCSKIEALYIDIVKSISNSFKKEEYSHIKNNLYLKLIYLSKIKERLN